MTTSKRLLSSVLFLSLAAAGCEKSADLGRIQEETLVLVKLHGNDIDRLQRRAEALTQRGRSLGGEAPGIAAAGQLLSEARAGLDQLRALVASAPGSLGNAVKSNNLDEVERSSEDLLEKLDAGEIRVRANLVAVENWLSNVENRPQVQAPATPPATKTDETPPTTPPGAPETGAGSGAGSGSAAAATPPPAAGSGSAQPK